MRDMTIGKPWRHMLAYALPLLLGNWFQLGYNAVDAIIVGRWIGRDALAAVGIASPVMNLVILAISGLCIGSGVFMSEFFGAKNWPRLRSQFATTLLAGGLFSLAVAIAGALLTQPILTLLAVPESIHGITATYTRIMFLGTPFTFFYNALAAALKSVGDAKTPLKFLVFSSVLNAALDVFFIGYLDFGIVCSATTTVVAEAASALLSILYLRRHVPELLPKRGEWHIRRDLLMPTLRYGGVTALQQAVQPIGKLLIQGQVNLLGVDVIAAFNAVTRVDDFAFTPEQSIASAMSTCIAQNRGAGKDERITASLRAGLIMEALYWVIIGSLTLLLKEPIMSVFLSGEEASGVMAAGVAYLSLMALFYLWPAMTNGIQGFFRGMGRMKITLLGTTIQTSIRVLMTWLLAPSMGIRGIAFACAAGWTAMLAVEIPLLVRTVKRLTPPEARKTP